MHPHRILSALVCVAALWTGASAGAETITGSGRSATESRAASGFDAIVVQGPINLVVRQGGGESVQVQADDNLLPLITTEVRTKDGGGTLVISPREGVSWRAKSPLLVTVQVVNLKALVLRGSSDAEVESLKTAALVVDVLGSGDVRLRGLDAGAVELRVTGSGDVQAQGRAGQLMVQIQGSGDVEAIGLHSDDARVDIAGSGDARVQAARGLKVSIAGSGDVVYRGQPAHLETNVAGSGTVRRTY